MLGFLYDICMTVRKVLKKKKKFDNAIESSTRSVTKWAIKIFYEWQATRGNKHCLEEQV